MIRSVLFNIIYYGGTVLIGIAIVPCLLLPRRLYVPFIRQYFRGVAFVERGVLGLDYVVVGWEHVLSIGAPYIVAAKHQSAYETLKLPLLFDRPVVVLKRELFAIPFWGWYARKAGNIAINRAAPRAALAQMVDGVRAALARGDTPVIFPQGTRVAVHDDVHAKPYKRGIAELYAATDVSVVPMAVNSGLYWPRNAFLKRGGVVTFQFLPPILPGLEKDAFMTRLENDLETASAALVDAPMIRPVPTAKFWTRPNLAVLMATILMWVYMVVWFAGAWVINKNIEQMWVNEADDITLSGTPPRVMGFPFRYHVAWGGRMAGPDINVVVPEFHVRFWPIPGTMIDIDIPRGLRANGAALGNGKVQVMTIARARVQFEIPSYIPPVWIKPEVQKLHDNGVTFRSSFIDLRDVAVNDGPAVGLMGTDGALFYDEDLQPQGQMRVTITGAGVVLDDMTANIKNPMGKSFARGLVNMLSTGPDGAMTQDLKIQNGAVYFGLMRVYTIGRIYWPVRDPRVYGVPLGSPTNIPAGTR
jgi:1-acyl-sn-glycerol-3-phosphate acyltransferase